MKNLVKLIEKEQLKNQCDSLSEIRKLTSPDATKLKWYLNDLLPASKQKTVFKSIKELKTLLANHLELKTQKRILKEIKRLNFADDLQPIEELTITVEWRKNRTWGANPTAEAYVYGLGNLTSGSIGGCGYDRCSTAVANVLNQIPQFLQLMYELKNKKSRFNNRAIFGYGSGYGILPSFEGGVGVGCYDRIFNSIGYEFKTISSGKTFDVYRISKVTAKVQRDKTKKLYNYSN